MREERGRERKRKRKAEYRRLIRVLCTIRRREKPLDWTAGLVGKRNGYGI